MNHVVGRIELFDLFLPVYWTRDGYYAHLDLCSCDSVDWTSLRDGGSIQLNERPVAFRVLFENTGSLFTARNLDELKQTGLKVLWRFKNPNGAKLEDVRSMKESYLTRYLENSQKLESEGDKYRAIQFTLKKGEWEYVFWDERTRIIYRPDSRFSPPAGENCSMLCTLVKIAVDYKPTAQREGFRLVIVRIWEEYIHPDALIARLEAEIANGNP